MNEAVSAKTVIDSIKDLPTLPAIYHKVSQIVNDPSASASQLANTLMADQTISTKLLRLVNSAIYGLPQQIDSVARAITIVGFRQVRDLVLAASVISQFENSPAAKFLDLGDFWEHTMATAVCSKKIAEMRSSVSPETYFTAGLIHDLGHLLLFDAMKILPVEEYLQQLKTLKLPARKLERKMLGLTHSDLGAELFKRWNLPPVYSEVALYHHSPGLCRRYRDEVAVVHVADVISHALSLGSTTDVFVPLTDPQAWEELKLPISQLDEICQFTSDNTPVLMSLFF